MSNANLENLISAWLDGRITAAESEKLQQQLRQSSEARAAFRKLTQFDAALREIADGRSSLSEPDAMIAQRLTANPKSAFVRTLLSAVLVAAIALMVGIYMSRPAVDLPIARITGLSGSLQWIGDGGHIVRDLNVGTELSGGTIEGMVPNSWFELTFRDGSTVAISGNAILTFSDQKQKILYLNKGTLSCSVKPQPSGKPMLIHTNVASLEVLGTQFELEAGLSSTVLNVSEGNVRVKRLSDGRVIDVPAKHRVIAAADHVLTSLPTPAAVNQWKSQLQSGPAGTFGTWVAPTDQRAARLKAIPFVPSENPSVTLSMVGQGVSRTDGSPVVLRPDSRIILRGRVKLPTQIYFGINMTHSNGEFAGKFRADKKIAMLSDKNEFEVKFDLSEFALDPCVRERKHELAHAPEGLLVTGVWCFTVNNNDDDQDNTANTAGLEVTEVEIVSSSGESELHVARYFETDLNNRTEAIVAKRWQLVSL